MVNTSIITALTDIQGDIIATLSAVAPIAIAIFAVFLGWRYAKALFKTVAK